MDYEKLYKAYYLQVYSYTISLAKNREIAEEITQNTFYKAVSTTSQFKGKSDELTWLCSIAKNLYHDEMRSRQRVADVSEINDLPSNENVENSVADSDMAFRIHLVLHRLEEPYKEVFADPCFVLPIMCNQFRFIKVCSNQICAERVSRKQYIAPHVAFFQANVIHHTLFQFHNRHYLSFIDNIFHSTSKILAQLLFAA